MNPKQFTVCYSYQSGRVTIPRFVRVEAEDAVHAWNWVDQNSGTPFVVFDGWPATSTNTEPQQIDCRKENHD